MSVSVLVEKVHPHSHKDVEWSKEDVHVHAGKECSVRFSPSLRESCAIFNQVIRSI